MEHGTSPCHWNVVEGTPLSEMCVFCISVMTVYSGQFPRGRHKNTTMSTILSETKKLVVTAI